MPEFPYTQVIGKLGDLLSKIRTIGIPSNANLKWLKSVGFTSSNDGTLIPVLKFIDFCDSGGAPTERWKNYRASNYKAVLGLAIQHGYSDLFAVYPDAHNRNDNELSSFFSTRSTAGQQVISKTVSTFKKLCSQAEFGADSAAHAIGADVVNATSPEKTESDSPNIPLGFSGPEIHIDIQIHISSEASAEQIDQIFASMAKHLYQRRSN